VTWEEWDTILLCFQSRSDSSGGLAFRLVFKADLVYCAAVHVTNPQVFRVLSLSSYCPYSVLLNF